MASSVAGPGDNGAMGKSTKLSLAIAALILGTSLVACDDGKSGAEAAAQQLATAVSALDVGSVAFDGKDAAAANDQLHQVFAALDPQKPEVQAGGLTLDGDKASAPLNYTWKFGDAEWKYTIPANFRKSGDKWLTVWNPGLLVPGLGDSEIVTKGSQSPQRADILGAGDVPLVTYRPVVNVGIDKPQLGSADPADSAGKLAALVGVDPAAYVQQVKAAGAQAFVRAITLREEGRTISDEQIRAIPGAAAFRHRSPWLRAGPLPVPCSVRWGKPRPNRSKRPMVPWLRRRHGHRRAPAAIRRTAPRIGRRGHPCPTRRPYAGTNPVRRHRPPARPLPGGAQAWDAAEDYP